VVAVLFPVNDTAVDTVDAVVIPAYGTIVDGEFVAYYDERVFDCAVGSMLVDGHFHRPCVEVVYGVDAAVVAELTREATAHLVR
jgi:hypothetical protein